MRNSLLIFSCVADDTQCSLTGILFEGNQRTSRNILKRLAEHFLMGHAERLQDSKLTSVLQFQDFEHRCSVSLSGNNLTNFEHGYSFAHSLRTPLVP